MISFSRTRKPRARIDELLVEEFDDELLVYDQRNDRVHCLSASASKVWRACDGSTSVEQLGAADGLGPEVVARALEELEASELLQGGVTRREATVRLAKIGAGAAVAPLIYSISAPPPALAATAAICTAISGTGANPGCGQVAGANSINTACNNAGCVVCAFSGCSNSQCPGLTGTSGYCMSAACSTSTCNKTTMVNQCCNGSASANCSCTNAGGSNCTSAQCGNT